MRWLVTPKIEGSNPFILAVVNLKRKMVIDMKFQYKLVMAAFLAMGIMFEVAQHADQALAQLRWCPRC